MSNMRAIARRLQREKNVRKLDELVLMDARSRAPKLRVGQKFGRGSMQIIITGIGTHTVTYETGDGYRGSLQIPFIDVSGESLPSHERALAEVER